MRKTPKIKITKQSENFSKWYLDVISSADMADYAPVKGCMIIKPNGYALWENIQKVLDNMFKKTGHKNAYFPIFIPESFIKKETEHIKGFAPELAVVTHAGGKKLEENLIIRPTSETIIYSSFAKWIRSWRDLPMLINQWCNVVRWELRTRLFLRTSEFLWQEGHTAHSTHKEALKEALKMLEIYRQFMEEYLAIPVIIGVKSKTEKFAGALQTFTAEALMQDKKALQCGTSHDLGQHFAKAFNVKFVDKNENQKYVWQTSWGVSTRLIGAIIMVHSDDNGLVLPPKIAPIKLVFVPIWTNNAEKEQTIKTARHLVKTIPNIQSEIDVRNIRPAQKYYEWERKGIPLRIEIGPRDIKNNQVIAVRRDINTKESIKQKNFSNYIPKILDKIQNNLFKKAKNFRDKNTHTAKTWKEFQNIIKNKGGFINANWCGSAKCEKQIKQKTKATIRCIPFINKKVNGKCIYCNKPAKYKALFAQAY